ncbi:hypothetical protein E2C01_089154 [Portunus trituberculatus]|uniref:Uncharacterized protein n=1 Tax=Portunus trituberculatus TaxID=210409 RepID=A0A5B7JNT3_PORTR|nr:hypothetical protein [Portunus trituberculatus]
MPLTAGVGSRANACFKGASDHF